jgi:glycerophosphoryl diester phosphodiesterase
VFDTRPGKSFRSGKHVTATSVIGHRGAPRAARENTVAAFRAAAAAGADGVELDARRTADGAIVVHHDPVFVPRSALPPWAPLLAEALDVCRELGLTVNVEIKNLPEDPDFDPAESVAAEVVRLAAAVDGGLGLPVSSFHLRTIEHVRALDAGGTVPTAWLTLGGWADVAEPVAVCVEGGHAALHPWHGSVTPDLVRAAHEAGLTVNTWTVDDPDRIRLLAEWGVDGICTNVPDVARSVLPSAPK